MVKNMGDRDKIIIVPSAFMKIRIRSASHNVVVKTRNGKEKVIYKIGGGK